MREHTKKGILVWNKEEIEEKNISQQKYKKRKLKDINESDKSEMITRLMRKLLTRNLREAPKEKLIRRR